MSNMRKLKVGKTTPNSEMPQHMGDNCKKTCATCPSIGSFNRLSYDNCDYSKYLQESTSPLMYRMSRYAHENCRVCSYDGKLWAPFDLVDYESELKNITRPASRCPSMKYDPKCPRSPSCISTFDNTWPVVYAWDVCPVVCNNIKKMKTPGYKLHERAYCGKPMKKGKKHVKGLPQPSGYGGGIDY